MPTIRKNSYYTDPALGTAFDNLASAFATPSGADVAGFANASATRNKDARLSELFNNPNDPNFDRKNIAAGNYAPSQSFYSVDLGDKTTRRNTDVAATSAANVADINNAGALARQFANPVILSDGQTVRLPDQTAAATGLPSMFGGNVTVNQGQTVARPDGSTIAGQAKPLNESEMKAIILGKLPENEQRAVALAPAGVTAIVGKDGPTNVFTADSVGREPSYQDTRQPQLNNYKTADGKVGTAVFDKDTGKWRDTQSGVEIPAGSQTVAAPSTQVNIDTKAPSAIETAYGEGIGSQIKQTVENAGAAPRNLHEIAQFRDALSRAGDNITTGPLSAYVLKGKQAIGGMLGTNLEGVPEAELINNIGFKLATAASRAISSRPTQFEFGQALAVKPGLALSKPGMLAMLSIMEQNSKDDQALATLAADPTNRQNWTSVVQKYYADHPVMSPFDPARPLEQRDIDELSRRASSGSQVLSSPSVPAPSAAVQYLQQNPNMKAEFDAKYGAGAAARALAGR